VSIVKQLKGSKKMRNRSLIFLATMILALAAKPAWGITQATNTNTVSPTLKVNVNVQNAIQLTLATGTQCAVTAGGGTDYSMNFGNVDALAINVPVCGSKFAPTTPGATSAVYYSDYKVTPVFTSQTVTTNTVTAYVSSNFAKANLSIVQDSAVPAVITDLTAMSTVVGAQTNIATNAVSGTALTRYLGVSVAPTNGAALTGVDAATITYTLTVQ
jgi:hypothetical protein